MTPGAGRQRFDEIIKDIDTATGFEDFSSHVVKILKSIPSPLPSQDLLKAKLKEYETVTDFARHHSTTSIHTVFLIWGLIVLDLWSTLLGTVVVYLGRLWLVDRMVWLYEDMKDATPEYKSWLDQDEKKHRTCREKPALSNIMEPIPG